MATVVPGPPALSGELSLFHTTDPLLSNSPVLVFYGHAATIGATSSRIQVHIFTSAGHASYARLAISPNSTYYSAVRNLPREEQGDEVCRGLAFGLKKYFAELSDNIKQTWSAEARAPPVSTLFGDEHVAILATRMNKVENVEEVISDIGEAFAERRLSWLDVDFVFPPGSIKEYAKYSDVGDADDLDNKEMLENRYGRYTELVQAIGDVAFLPTSKIKRAPSKPTMVGRSTFFSRMQKENVRKELFELLSTEESYSVRLQELCDLKLRLQGHLSEDNKPRLHTLLPGCINDIARRSTELVECLQSIYQSTEKEAIHDIEATLDEQTNAQTIHQDYTNDSQGILAVAKGLLAFLPTCRECYVEYLENHSRATQLLRNEMRDTQSMLTEQLQGVGEQKVTSLFIEPVQRLPRYSLYIDTIVKQLPVRHPAISQLLRARDLVTEICDSAKTEDSAMETLARLRTRVSGWPSDVSIFSRLVTAADITELVPPFTLQGCDGSEGMLLLFTDALVVLEKRGTGAIGARALLTELESRQVHLRPSQSRPTTPQDIVFVRLIRLDFVECLESQDGQTIQVLIRAGNEDSAESSDTGQVGPFQTLRLDGFYARKAGRFIEDMVRARVEGRFSETERESFTWEVRATNPATDSVGLFCALFDDSNLAHVTARAQAAAVRVVVDIDRHSDKPQPGQAGIRTVVCVTPMRDGLWRLSFNSSDGTANVESVPLADVTLVLRRRLLAFASVHYGTNNSDTFKHMLVKYADALQSINIRVIHEGIGFERDRATVEKHARPKSPKKLLSNILSSSTGPASQPSVSLKKDLPTVPLPMQTPRYQISGSCKPPSRESRPSSRDQLPSKSVTAMSSTDQLPNQAKKLEDVLCTYMLALQARKGNIVGRSLKMRSVADELVINELYNGLLEDPNLMVLAAQATVDILFAAFEKFLNVAWKEQFGQIMPLSLVQQIQSKAETMFPADFDVFFRSALSTMSPQNQRAFKGIIKLLADLLDGTGNDSDRGILTAAFAEVLVTEGNPHDYIALIDRFVDDTDTYFGEALDDVPKVNDDSSGSHKRTRSVNAGSISSNTSSFRKKFGLGALSRETIKSEQESKVATVWRTLSKSTRGEGSPANSISKGLLHRSHSTDGDGRHLAQRPTSQDGSLHLTPNVGEESSFMSTTSSLNLGLSTIGEHPSFIPKQPPRKKRRSSLSDLKALEASQTAPAWSPPMPPHPPAPLHAVQESSQPTSPVSSNISSKASSGRLATPPKAATRSRLPSSFRKDGISTQNKTSDGIEQRPSGKGIPDDVNTARSNSGIPTLTPRTPSPQKGISPVPGKSLGLTERRDAGNAIRRPMLQPDCTNKNSTAEKPGGPTSPKKLRMQSPQKIRERLQNEQNVVALTQASLQDELSNIGNELTSNPGRAGSTRTTGRPNSLHSRSKSFQNNNSIDIAARVLRMEGRLPEQINELNTRIAGVQSDLATSLVVSENKCKKLDELYREANSENEALYARFNDELRRVMKAVQNGEGVDELKVKLKEVQEEAAKLKRENGRLKRENVGLRSQLREG